MRRSHSMFSSPVVVALLTGVALSCQAGTASKAPESGKEEEGHVRATEEAFAKARLRADLKALGQILADDYSGINQSGNRRDRVGLLNLFKDYRMDDIVLSQVEIQLLGSSAIVSGAQSETVCGKKDHLLFTRFYHRREERWLLVSSTQFFDPRRTTATGSLQ